jgi:hypothetical protein
MSQSVICSGCGARLEVSEDYARKKMRCGQCGVIFDLPEPANRSSIPATPGKPAPGPKPRAIDKEPDPVVAVPVSRTPIPQTDPALIASVKAPTTAPLPSPEETGLEDSDDDEFAFADGKDDHPYVKAETTIRECPHCHATVAPEAKACSACGFLLVKTRRTNEPLQWRWQTGWPFRRRLIIFLICQGLVLTLFVSGSLGGMSLYAFPLPYLVFTGMTAFLLGTYNWVDLTRNKRGKLRLTQTWRICFFLRPTTTLRVRDYEELTAGAEGHFGAINWIVVLFVLVCGVFAGLVVGFFFDLKLLFLVVGGVVSCLSWWIFTWHKNTYSLSLCRDHGYPVVTLYRGWNRQQMEDMAETICGVAGLPLRR